MYTSRLAVTDRARTVLVFAVVAMACDVVVAITAYENWRSFATAPNNGSLVPGDDPAYFLAGFGYAVTSALRYLVLAGVVVALVRPRPSTSGDTGTIVRLRRAFAGVLVATELGFLAAAWNQANPSEGWFVLRVATLVVSTLVCSLVVVAIVRRSGRAAAR